MTRKLEFKRGNINKNYQKQEVEITTTHSYVLIRFWYESVWGEDNESSNCLLKISYDQFHELTDAIAKGIKCKLNLNYDDYEQSVEINKYDKVVSVNVQSDADRGYRFCEIVLNSTNQKKLVKFLKG